MADPEQQKEEASPESDKSRWRTALLVIALLLCGLGVGVGAGLGLGLREDGEGHHKAEEDLQGVRPSLHPHDRNDHLTGEAGHRHPGEQERILCPSGDNNVEEALGQLETLGKQIETCHKRVDATAPVSKCQSCSEPSSPTVLCDAASLHRLATPPRLAPFAGGALTLSRPSRTSVRFGALNR